LAHGPVLHLTLASCPQQASVSGSRQPPAFDANRLVWQTNRPWAPRRMTLDLCHWESITTFDLETREGRL
jgi:hypothetical protein